MNRLAAPGAALLALLAGCGGGEPGAAPSAAPGPEVVDVARAPEVSPDNDVKAAPRKVGLAGVLPDDFPDLPVYLPASVVDFGMAGGRRFVLLHVPHGRAAIEQGWRATLAGRRIAVEGRGGRWELKSGGRTLATASFAAISGGTEIRIEY
jgi:hypothetical protein